MTNLISKKRLWTARIISGVIVLFMLFDSLSKIFKAGPVIDATIKLGYVEHHIVLIGILGLVPTILYVIPRTNVLGAILLTAYFGGAVATNLRVDAPLFSNILFPVYISLIAWIGIWLRNEALRELIPLKRGVSTEKTNKDIGISESV